MSTAGMRILLQDIRNGLYLENSGVWNHDLNAALDFGSSQRAIDYAEQNKIKEARVVAVFRSGNYAELVSYPISTAQVVCPEIPADPRVSESV
jgi:hypothetical protein